VTGREDDRETRQRIERLVAQLAGMAASLEAIEALGVDGALRDQVDISFLEDPLDYIAYDLAQAVLAMDGEDGATNEVPPLLATLVAEFKLCRALQGRIDEPELVRRTLESMSEEPR
jgi:hypothetical protein